MDHLAKYELVTKRTETIENVKVLEFRVVQEQLVNIKSSRENVVDLDVDTIKKRKLLLIKSHFIITHFTFRKCSCDEVILCCTERKRLCFFVIT